MGCNGYRTKTMQMILAGLPPHHVEMPSDCGLYPCPIMGVITSLNPVFTMPTPHGLQCRPMTAEDVPQVLALQHTCYQPEFHEPVQAFDSKLRSSPDTCWVISTRAASIAAYLVPRCEPQAGNPLLMLMSCMCTTWRSRPTCVARVPHICCCNKPRPTPHSSA